MGIYEYGTCHPREPLVNLGCPKAVHNRFTVLNFWPKSVRVGLLEGDDVELPVPRVSKDLHYGIRLPATFYCITVRVCWCIASWFVTIDWRFLWLSLTVLEPSVRNGSRSRPWGVWAPSYQCCCRPRCESGSGSGNGVRFCSSCGFWRIQGVVIGAIIAEPL